MICIIFSSLCLSTLAFSSPFDSLCLSHIHHVPFWAPGAFPFSCNTIRTNICGLLLYFYFPKKEKHKHFWNPVDIFQSQLLVLSLTLHVKMHDCCDSEVRLPSKPNYLRLCFHISEGFSIMASQESFLLQLVLLEVLSNWMTEDFRFFKFHLLVNC